MKKRFLFALGIIMTASCMSLSSCGDDDEEPQNNNMCTCTERDLYTGESATQTINPSTYAVGSCSELAEKFNSYYDEDDDLQMSCY